MLDGVSCPSRVSCFAVGSYFAAGKERPLAERWNGRRWQILQTPSPAANGGALASVSCPSASACTAVGRKAGPDAMLAERWNGTSWTIQVTPHPAGAGALTGVACASAGSCAAVGGDFSEIWNGTSWAFQATATITGSQGIGLSAVSCAAPSACTAVGFYFTTRRGPLTLVEAWNGSTWQKQPSPNRRGAHRNTLAGVSCASANVCTAVGEWAANDFAPPHLLALRWNGTAWSLVPAPSPAGPTLSELFGVSCPTARACTAAGLDALLNGPGLTFAIASR